MKSSDSRLKILQQKSRKPQCIYTLETWLRSRNKSFRLFQPDNIPNFNGERDGTFNARGTNRKTALLQFYKQICLLVRALSRRLKIVYACPDNRYAPLRQNVCRGKFCGPPCAADRQLISLITEIQPLTTG